MLLTPTEAPTVHLELLPDTAVAAQVLADSDSFTISMWASGPPMPTIITEDHDSFYENHCSDCEFYTEEIEVDCDTQEITGYYRDEEVTLRGTAYAYPPCGCYQNGVASVYFPCAAGFDGPTDEDGEDLSSDFIRYSLTFQYSNDSRPITYTSNDEIVIQAYTITDGNLKVGTELYQAINTYDGGEVCWGNNDTPYTLNSMYMTYVNTPANEDLCSFETHASNISDAENEVDDEDELIDIDAYVINKQQPAAIVCAYISESPSAFMLLATSGVTVDKCVAHINAYLYRNVAIDADTVMNVWATDVLPIGKRLLFADVKGEEFNNGIYLGQVDSNFNLQPCKSIQQLSSEPVAQDSNLSPA